MIHPDENSEIPAEGILEIMPEGHGFLRSPDYGCQPGPDDIYVATSHIRRLHLKSGDTILCRVRLPRVGETWFMLVEVDAVNSEPPDQH